MTVSLSDQIACVRSEIARRERAYAHWESGGLLSQGATDHELAAMRAVLATLEAMQWRSIETAPKDGSFIDLWISHSPDRADLDGREACCAWVFGRWQKWSELIDDYAEVEQATPLRDGGMWRATHWMPLPDAPDRKGEHG